MRFNPRSFRSGIVCLLCNVLSCSTDILDMTNIVRRVASVALAVAVAVPSLTSPAVADTVRSVVSDRIVPSPPSPGLMASSAAVFPNHFANGFVCQNELNPDNEFELICRKGSEVLESV